MTNPTPDQIQEALAEAYKFAAKVRMGHAVNQIDAAGVLAAITPVRDALRDPAVCARLLAEQVGDPTPQFPDVPLAIDRAALIVEVSTWSLEPGTRKKVFTPSHAREVAARIVGDFGFWEAKLRCKLAAHYAENNEAQQILGRALGYPEVDAGAVCVGEHVLVTIAQEAADAIRRVLAEPGGMPTREEIAEVVERAMSSGAMIFDSDRNPTLWRYRCDGHVVDLLALLSRPPPAPKGGDATSEPATLCPEAQASYRAAPDALSTPEQAPGPSAEDEYVKAVVESLAWLGAKNEWLAKYGMIRDGDPEEPWIVTDAHREFSRKQLDKHIARFGPLINSTIPRTDNGWRPSAEVQIQWMRERLAAGRAYSQTQAGAYLRNFVLEPLCDALARAIERIEAPIDNGWRPIESAPRDGTDAAQFLATPGGEDITRDRPTHWQPLPAPPSPSPATDGPAESEPQFIATVRDALHPSNRPELGVRGDGFHVADPSVAATTSSGMVAKKRPETASTASGQDGPYSPELDGHVSAVGWLLSSDEAAAELNRLTAEYHRRGVKIIELTEIAGAHLCRAEAAERALEAAQARHAETEKEACRLASQLSIPRATIRRYEAALDEIIDLPNNSDMPARLLIRAALIASEAKAAK